MRLKKKSKLRILLVIISFLAIAIFLHIRLVVFPDGFDMPINYQIGFFGASYYELYSIQTPKEKEIGEMIVERAKNSMEYLGNEDDSPETDGLSYFYHWGNHPRPTSAEASVTLKKAVIHGDTGHVWIEYTQEWYDKDDNRIFGAANILALCNLEKNEKGEWTVTYVSEPA